MIRSCQDVNQIKRHRLKPINKVNVHRRKKEVCIENLILKCIQKVWKCDFRRQERLHKNNDNDVYRRVVKKQT